jgi:hypothetical protein
VRPEIDAPEQPGDGHDHEVGNEGTGGHNPPVAFRTERGDLEDGPLNPARPGGPLILVEDLSHYVTDTLERGTVL